MPLITRYVINGMLEPAEQDQETVPTPEPMSPNQPSILPGTRVGRNRQVVVYAQLWCNQINNLIESNCDCF